MKIFINYNFLRIDDFGKITQNEFVSLLHQEQKLRYDTFSHKITGRQEDLYNLLVDLTFYDTIVII